jgi:hypothetical protein
MSLIIITSGAFVDPELVAEFGALPPAFLPIGHQRLYEAQLQAMSNIDCDIVLTIPDSFQIPEADDIKLKAHGVQTLRIPDGMALGEAILYSLDVLAPDDIPIRILHGDTLLQGGLPEGTDLVAMAFQPDNYNWGTIDRKSADEDVSFSLPSEILAGYFAFSSEAHLRRSLARARGDFIEALRAYDAALPLKRVHTENWLDFGHLQTFYRSRCSIHTQRSFNELALSFNSVHKSGSNGPKIEAEAYWFENIPFNLRLYTPAFLGSEKLADGKPTYSLEYLPLPTLHELFVFGDLAKATWRLILDSCNDFLSECLSHPKSESRNAIHALSALTREKTPARLEEFHAKTGISISDEWRLNGQVAPSLERISLIATESIDFTNPQLAGIMHGDFCFTNIFYDFRTQRIKVIDPRGSIGGKEPSISGDLRYDISKLAHSIIGGYDLILAGRYQCAGIKSRDVQFDFLPSSSINHLHDLAKETTFLDMSMLDPEVLAITIHLFISMLPLHSDSPRRQEAFISAALRLFTLLERQL